MRLASLVFAFLLAASNAAQAFVIRNNGTHGVLSIYQSSTDNDGWGPDRLIGYLEPGSYWTSPLSDYCHYDLRIVWRDGHSDEWSDFDTCNNDLDLTY